MCKLNTAAAIWIKSLPSRLFEVTLNTYNLHGLVMRWSSIVSGNLECNIWEKMKQVFMLAFVSSSPVLNEYMIRPNAFGNTQNQHHMEHSLTWLTLATTIYLMFVNLFDICFISFSFRIGQTFHTMLFVVVYFQL